MKAFLGASESLKTSLAFQYCYDLLAKILDHSTSDISKVYVYYIGHISRSGSASFVFGKIQRMNQHTVSRILLKFLKNYHDLVDLLSSLYKYTYMPFILVIDDFQLFLNPLPSDSRITAKMKLLALLQHLSNHVILDILRPRMPNLLLLEELHPGLDKELKREMLLLRNFGFDVSYITDSLIDGHGKVTPHSGLLNTYSLKYKDQSDATQIEEQMELVPAKEHSMISHILDIYSKLVKRQEKE